MNGLTPFVDSQESIFELWTLVCWVLVLLVGIGSGAGVACIIGLVWVDLHPH